MSDPAKAETHRREIRAQHATRQASKALVPIAPGEGGLAYASRALPGGRASLMELARLSSHETVKRIVAEWDSLSDRKKTATRLEVLCEGFEMAPADFLAETVKAAFDHNTDLSKLILAVNMPRIVTRAVKEAQTRTGFKDRQMLMEASKLVPKGGGVNVNTNVNAQAKAAAVVAPEQTHGLPSFEADLVETSALIRSGE